MPEGPLPIVDRIPPHNLDAEMALLGSVMVDADLWPVVREHVAADDFYAHVHETIFAAMEALVERRIRLGKLELVEELRNRDMLDNVGGASYLSSLMDTVQTAASAEWCAKIVAEKAGLRRLIHAGIMTTQLAYESEEDGPLPVANRAIALVESAVERGVPNRGVTGSALVREFEADWLASRARRLLTPWGPINSAPRGFGLRELTVWAGNPAAGKSAAILNLAEFTARKYGDDVGRVALFPLEVGRTKTEYRFASLYTGIDSKLIEERVDLTTDEHTRVRKAIAMLGSVGMTIFEKRPAPDLSTLRMWLRRMKKGAEGLSAVFLDHVGGFREVTEARDPSAVHRAQERIFQGLLDLADEFECAMHVVMHIRRLPRDKDGKFPKPTMFDLRGGGNPEGWAHTVMLVWRPDPKDDPANGAFICEKARSGGEGTFFLEYQGVRSLWRDRGDLYGGGIWFPQPTATPDESEREVSLPYKDSVELYEAEEFPSEAPEEVSGGEPPDGD